jgi:hypothetical protein
VAVSVASFLVVYPEFFKAGEPMIGAHLALTELEVSDSFGEQRDQAVILRLADNLALSPWGRNARMVAPSDATSTYGKRFAAMAEANAVSASRLGSAPVATRDGYDDGCP